MLLHGVPGYFCFFLLLLGTSMACTYRKTAIGPGNCETAVSYRMDIVPLVNVNCALPACHRDGFVPGNYMQYAPLKEDALSGKIKRNVFELGIMPPGKVLTAQEKELLECWLAAGAPDN